MARFKIILALTLMTFVHGEDITEEDKKNLTHYNTKPLNTKGLVMKPGNEWGSYYNINMTAEDEVFQEKCLQLKSRTLNKSVVNI